MPSCAVATILDQDKEAHEKQLDRVTREMESELAKAEQCHETVTKVQHEAAAGKERLRSQFEVQFEAEIQVSKRYQARLEQEASAHKAATDRHTEREKSEKVDDVEMQNKHFDDKPLPTEEKLIFDEEIQDTWTTIHGKYPELCINGTPMARHGLILGQHGATVITVLLDMSHFICSGFFNSNPAKIVKILGKSGKPA